MAYNIINRTGKFKIGLRKWNPKYTSDKTWDGFKPHLCTDNQELKGVSDETVVDTGFKSENIVSEVVEGIVNVLQPTDNDNEDTII